MKPLIIGMLIACAMTASAQRLPSGRGLLGRRLQRPVASPTVEQSPDKTDSAQTNKAKYAEIAAAIEEPKMRNRIKRLLDEPCPTDLAYVSFSNAVMMAKAGKPDGYFALALHYATKGDDAQVDPDPDKAWHLLKKSADLGSPIGTLIFAMAEEKLMGGLKNLQCRWNEMGPYLVTGSVHLVSYKFHPFRCETNYVGWSSSYGRTYHRGVISCYSVTNTADVAHIRGLYEKAITLGVSGARSELKRFEERVSASLERKAKEEAETDGRSGARRANAEFALSALGIPLESQAEMLEKSESERNESERRKMLPLEERVAALEAKLEKEGR